MLPSIKRQQIAQVAVDQYLNQDLVYGKRDCAHLAATMLDAFEIGHALKLARPFKNAAQAKRALKTLGFADLAQAIDSTGCERIGPASALPCDLIAVRADGYVGGWSLAVMVGPNKVMAFIEHDGRIFADTANLLELCIYASNAGSEVIAWRVG